MAAVETRKRHSWVKYAVVDAFTRIPFKGNPAAVCFLRSSDDDDEEVEDSERHLWMQSVAAEFNLPVTAFLTPGDTPLHFHIRWFTTICEVKICGHATLAAAHHIFDTGIVAGDALEFATEWGVLMAKKICEGAGGGEYGGGFCVELHIPAASMSEPCTTEEAIHSIPATLSGAKIVEVKRTSGEDLLINILLLPKGLDLIASVASSVQKRCSRGPCMCQYIAR